MFSDADNQLLTRTNAGQPMGELLRRFWIPVLLVSELPDPDCAPVRVRVLGQDLVAFRDTTGKVGLLRERCAHRGASLYFGRNEECGLRCVYHGWKYDTEGNCLDTPNEPANRAFKNRIHQPAYPCREAGNMVWAYLGPPESEADFPQFPFNLVPDDHVYVAKILVQSNYLQALEGDLDNSHASFLHAGIHPDGGLPFLDRLREAGNNAPPILGEFWQELARYFAHDTAPRCFRVDTSYGLMVGWRRDAGDDRYQWRLNHWLLPATALIANGPEGSTCSANLRVPVDDEASLVFRLMWNSDRPISDVELEAFRPGSYGYPELIPGTFLPKENNENDYLIDRDLQRTSSVSGIYGVAQQDLAVTESMGTVADRTREHLGQSDAVVIAMRRRLMAVATALAETGEVPYAARHGEIYRQMPIDLIVSRGVGWDEIKEEQLLGTVTSSAGAK